jgi:hypothetical protein
MIPTGEIKSSAPRASLKTEFPYLLACTFLFLLCVLVPAPFANSAFVDDWSYSYVALQLAKTGHFHYSGWGSPSIVLQCLWAAPWIRHFGFSFNLLRLISLPFSLAFILLTYALGRKIGLTAPLALFGSLIVAVSPLYIPLAASFMTEPYACSMTMLAVYAAVCAAEASSSTSAGLWLWILTVASIVGGSDRQTVWVVPMALIPYLVLKRRRERVFAAQAIGAFVLTVSALVIVAKYFSPAYAPTSLSEQQLIAIVKREGFYTIRRITSVFLVALWLSLPALLCAVPFWKRFSGRQFRFILVLTAVISPFLLVGKKGMVPFLGNIMTPYGILDYQTEGLGFIPPLLGRPLQYGLTVFFVFVLVTWGVLAYNKQVRFDLFRRPAGIVFALFVCSYVPLLIPAGLVDFIFDRYSVPVFPVIALCLVWSVRTRIEKIPRAAYACLLTFAVYGMVTTHDYYAALRARDAAAEKLEKRSVPVEDISAGFEHDGWTELLLTGKIGTMMYGETFFDLKFWFWRFTPAMRHEYVAVAYRLSARTKDPVVEIPFTAWSYPFHRKIVMLKQRDL